MQWANNETGVVFPVELLASMAHAVGALFHCDAVQAAGRVEIDANRTEIDMLSISAHKMHGPKGIGALYVRNGREVGATYSWRPSGTRKTRRNGKHAGYCWLRSGRGTCGSGIAA